MAGPQGLLWREGSGHRAGERGRLSRRDLRQRHAHHLGGRPASSRRAHSPTPSPRLLPRVLQSTEDMQPVRQASWRVCHLLGHLGARASCQFPWPISSSCPGYHLKRGVSCCMRCRAEQHNHGRVHGAVRDERLSESESQPVEAHRHHAQRRARAHAACLAALQARPCGVYLTSAPCKPRVASPSIQPRRDNHPPRRHFTAPASS